jgi:predicted MPP superfamily phosphohydrolase
MDKKFFVMILRASIFLPSLFVVEYYFFRYFQKSLVELNIVKDRKKLTKLILFVLIFVNLFPVFQSLVSVYSAIYPQTDFEIPENFLIDYLFRVPSWFVILIVVQIILLFSPVHFIFFLIKKINHLIYDRIKNYLWRYLILLSIFFVAYVPLRSYYDYKNVRVDERIYFLNTSKKDLDDLKVVFFSDIQLDRFNKVERVQNYINKINELNADLVLAGGDFISGDDSNYIPVVASLAGKIKANYGVYSAIGDHDFSAFKKMYFRSLDSVKSALKANNVNMIDNGNLLLYVNESLIKITFLSNTYIKSFDENVFDSLAVSNPEADLKILVAHQPDEYVARKAMKYGYNIYLSGHTHGGQVNFLFPIKNISPVMFETKFIHGDFWFGNLLMIVNRGLGMSTMPIRYHSVPEITLIRIKIKNLN